tara:strand:- start:3571 stop:3834 length:264 start_codon:yes stop_codon:yes gene_type:complete
MNKKELRSHKRNISLDIQNMQTKHATLKTNHILHLILSVVTAGVWVIVWLFVSHFDVRGRINLEKKIGEAQKTLISIEDQLDDLEAS